MLAIGVHLHHGCPHAAPQAFDKVADGAQHQVAGLVRRNHLEHLALGIGQRLLACRDIGRMVAERAMVALVFAQRGDINGALGGVDSLSVDPGKAFAPVRAAHADLATGRPGRRGIGSRQERFEKLRHRQTGRGRQEVLDRRTDQRLPVETEQAAQHRVAKADVARLTEQNQRLGHAVEDDGKRRRTRGGSRGRNRLGNALFAAIVVRIDPLKQPDELRTADDR